jgi:hypothetical protein
MPRSKSVSIPSPLHATPIPTPKGTPTVPVSSPVTAVPSAPPTTSSTVVLSTSPPVVNIPAAPAGFVPVNLLDYKGAHPKTGQVAAVPDAVAELTGSTTYATTFGPAAPEVGSFVQQLDDAVGWTQLRNEVEAFLLYVRSQEAVAWKAGLTQIDQAKAVYDITLVRNPSVPVLFPALTRLLEVTNAIGLKSAAARKRNKAAKVKDLTAAATANAVNAPPATGANAAPAVATATNAPLGGTGGSAAH